MQLFVELFAETASENQWNTPIHTAKHLTGFRQRLLKTVAQCCNTVQLHAEQLTFIIGRCMFVGSLKPCSIPKKKLYK